MTAQQGRSTISCNERPEVIRVFRLISMDLKALIQGVAQITEDKKIEAAKVFEAIEGALAAAYKRSI